MLQSDTFYLIICISFNLLLWTYPFPFVWTLLLDMWRWLTICSSPFTLCDLWGFPGSSPIGNLPQFYSSLLVAMFFFHFPYLPPPIHRLGLFWPSIVMATCWPHSLHIHLYVFLSHYSTLSFYTSYIIDCIYTHVIIYLVLKVTKTTKELHSSFLVYSPRKKWQAR